MWGGGGGGGGREGGEQEGTQVLKTWPRAIDEGGRMKDGE